MKLLVNAPINALSFGNVSVNILKELYKKNIDLCLFPIGNKTEIQAFDKANPKFLEYLQDATNKRYEKIKKDLPESHRLCCLDQFNYCKSESESTDQKAK